MAFKINIGMSTNSIMNQIKSGEVKVPEKTKQLIFNFCQHDKDGIVSNKNELAMLNSWLSGSEKVKMPEMPKDNYSKEDVRESELDARGRFKFGEKVGSKHFSFTVNAEEASEERSPDGRFPAKYHENTDYGTKLFDKRGKMVNYEVSSEDLHARNGRITEKTYDSLIDTDGDGYADKRVVSTRSDKGDNFFVDMNMNGIPDNEEK